MKFLKRTLTDKGKKITMKSVKMIKWNQVVAFFHDLKNEKKGVSSRRNYYNSLKSYFKPVGKFKGKFEEIRIGKKRTQVKPVSLTHSLFRKETPILTEVEWAKVQKVLPKKHHLLFTVLNHSGLRI